MFVCVLAAGERARSWHRHKKTEEEIDLEGLAARLFEGSEQEDAARPRTEEITRRTMSSCRRRQRSARPKIADGLVANIWFESTLCSSKSGEILARINSPFVVCFPKREENYEQKHYQLGKL